MPTKTELKVLALGLVTVALIWVTVLSIASCTRVKSSPVQNVTHTKTRVDTNKWLIKLPDGSNNESSTVSTEEWDTLSP